MRIGWSIIRIILRIKVKPFFIKPFFIFLVILSYIFRKLANFKKFIIPAIKIEFFGHIFKIKPLSNDFWSLSYEFEKETTREILRRKYRVSVDVGAHVGRYSFLLSKRSKLVLGFEPNPLTFKILRENLKEFPNVRLFNYALHYKGCKIFLYYSPYETGESSLKIKNIKKVLVEAKPLDKIVEELGVDPSEIDLIKIDVEGAELDVLRGMRKILEKGSPTLIVEVWDRGVFEYLRKFNYVFRRIERNNYIAYKKNG